MPGKPWEACRLDARNKDINISKVPRVATRLDSKFQWPDYLLSWHLEV